MKGKSYTTEEKIRMLRQADKLLRIEIVQEALEKKWKMSLMLGSKPWAQAASGTETCGWGPVFDANGVPILSSVPLHLCV